MNMKRDSGDRENPGRSEREKKTKGKVGSDEQTEECVGLGWDSRCLMDFGWVGVLQVGQLFFCCEQMKSTLVKRCEEERIK